MEKISPITVSDVKVVETNDLAKISNYVKLEFQKAKGSSHDAIDSNTLKPFLYSQCYNFVAQYNKEVDAVGFYQVHEDENVVTFKHTTEEKLATEDVVFPVKDIEIESIITDVLPQGDVLIKFYDGEVTTLNGESVEEFVTDSGGWREVSAVLYTGLSKGQIEMQSVDISDFK